jgi:hypothetical protein
LVVLAHLRRRWSLRGKEVFGFLSPSSRACEVGFNAFVEVKSLFFTAPEAKKRRRKEVTGVAGCWIGRGWCVQSVAAVVRHGTLGLWTGASGRSWDRRVRSSPREAAKHVRSIGRGGTSGHDRPDASGHEWMLTRNDWTLALCCPVRQACASGRLVTVGAFDIERMRPVDGQERPNVV